MVRHRRLRVLLLLFAALTKPLSAQVADVAAHIQRIAGCYNTHMGGWSGPFPPDPGDSVSHTPPPQFQLDTVAVNFAGQSRLAVLPARLGGHSPLPATWEPRGADSIIVVWSTGFVGVRLHLAVHHDSLIGHATTFHDDHRIGEPPDPSAPVIATRRACPP